MCKLGKKGRGINKNLILEEIKKDIFKLFSVNVEVINFKIYKYHNIRHKYLLNEKLYNSLPLIIPGIYKKNNFDLESIYQTSQDLAQVFYSPEIIENEIRDKFIMKSTKYYLDNTF